MRLDDVMSSVAMRFYADEGAVAPRSRDMSMHPSRSFARGLDRMRANAAGPGSGRVNAADKSDIAAARSQVDAPPAHDRSTLSAQALRDGLSSLPVIAPEGAGRTQPPAAERPGSQTTTIVAETKPEAAGAAQEIRTPFGVMKLGAEQPRLVKDVLADSEMHAYFLTHQPGDWMYQEAAREEFAKIYGRQALVTLDWDGTVPENVDSVWVTKRPLDPTGRPLPGGNPLLTSLGLTGRA
ncbi:MAG: hypothetical protein ABIG68_14660 [Acidobacteriota bacterium]